MVYEGISFNIENIKGKTLAEFKKFMNLEGHKHLLEGKDREEKIKELHQTVNNGNDNGSTDKV